MKVTFSYGLTNDQSKVSQSINARIRHGKNIKSNTLECRRTIGIEIPKSYWDFKKKALKNPSTGSWSFDDRKNLLNIGGKLQEISNAFEREFLQLKIDNKLRTMTTDQWIDWCEKTLNKGMGIDEDEKEAPFFLDKFRQYIDFKKSDWRSNTMRNNESSYRMLSAFMDFGMFQETCFKDEDRDFIKWSKWYSDKYGRSRSYNYRTNEIDLKFYANLKDWHLERGNDLSGAFTDQIKHIKKVLHYYQSHEGIEVHYNINSKEFKGYKSNKSHVILTEDELALIFQYKGLDSLENVRDLIKVQYHMCLRYDELQSELKKGVQDLAIVKAKLGYRWTIHQGKVNERKGVPVNREVMVMIQENRLPHIITRQRYNDYINDLAKAVGIKSERNITSHDIRRSFCTNKFNQGYSFTQIMIYSGHTTEEKLRIYIRPENMDLDNSIPTGYEK